MQAFNSLGFKCGSKIRTDDNLLFWKKYITLFALNVCWNI